MSGHQTRSRGPATASILPGNLVKFLCEQCKAKYQIADDKVAGKTVRMKCRKCGHMIEVRAEVTESSVSRGLPEGTLPDGGPSASAAPPPVNGTGPKPPQRPAPPRAGSLSTSLNKPPPRPGSAPRNPLGSSAALQQTNTSGSRPPPSALAGAFQKSVAKEDPGLLDFSGSKEWYVAINGVPVGPVRIAELRRKASLGAVGEDSLVWQEGMEEWRPVKAISDLAVIVREAAQSGRPSLVAPPPQEGRSSYPPGVLKAPSRPPAGGIPPRPPSSLPPKPTPLAASARSNVLPFAPRTATAEKLEDLDALDATEVGVASMPAPSVGAFTPPPPGAAAPPRSMTAPDPFASPAALHGSQQISSPFGAPALHTSQALAPPFGAATSTDGRSSIALGPPIVATETPAQSKRETPWVAIAMVVMAAFFGMTAAYAIFFRKAETVVQTAPSASAAAPSPSTSASAAPSASASDSVVAEFPSSTPTTEKGPTVAKAGGPSKPASANNGSAPVDLRGLMGGSGNGPSTGAGGNAGGGSGGSSLSEDQIRSVLNQHSLAVRRSCWERGSSQASSVAVTATIQVNGAGQVSSVNADGNDPAVAKCIETSIRSWQFPATGGASTVKIPFKFVRQ